MHLPYENPKWSILKEIVFCRTEKQDTDALKMTNSGHSTSEHAYIGQKLGKTILEQRKIEM